MKTCMECHFFSKKGVSPNGNIYENSMNADRRNIKLITSSRYIQDVPYKVKCYKGYWHSDNFHNNQDIINQILNVDRKKCIFFSKYKENVSLDTVDEEMIIKENRNEKIITRWLSIAAIIVSIVSLTKSFIGK